MTFKPTLEMAILLQRVGEGDFSAVPELWPLLFDTPLDPKRPAEDIANDIAKRLNELTADSANESASESSAKTASKSKRTMSNAEFEEFLAAIGETLDTVFNFVRVDTKSKQKR